MAVAPNDLSHHGPLVLAGQDRGESVEMIRFTKSGVHRTPSTEYAARANVST